jgi:hypothetical protein
MNPIEEHQDVLQNIEAVVIQVWRKHPELTNYAVMRAYEAALTLYKAEARQHTPKPVSLTGLDASVYEAVKVVCDWRLDRAAPPNALNEDPISLEDMVSCLSRLRKSVEHWTKQGGRQGYLQFIDQFLP